MNDYLIIKIKDYPLNKIILKMHQINVDLYQIEQKDNIIYLKITSKDYDKIKKYLKTLEITKVKSNGIDYFKFLIKKNYLLIISVLLFLLCLFFSTHIIVDVKIIHDDPELVELIKEELESYHVTKFSFKKSFQDLQTIKKQIKEKYLDKIDWLEINKVGMRYIVRIEERIINDIPTPQNYCHVYASKSALIRKIKIASGVAVVDINDYVQEGDLLITGDIMLNNNIENRVCANAEVYGEVWYTVKIKIPFEYYDEQKTGKKRKNYILNIKDKNYQLLNNRLTNFVSNKRKVMDVLGVKLYLREDEEIIKIKKTYTEEEALNEALNRAKQNVQIKLGDKGKIINQKVLQKNINDSTMEIEVFIIAEEEISKQLVAKEDIDNDS